MAPGGRGRQVLGAAHMSSLLVLVPLSMLCLDSQSCLKSWFGVLGSLGPNQ